jgi:hypothetical protein
MSSRRCRLHRRLWAARTLLIRYSARDEVGERVLLLQHAALVARLAGSPPPRMWANA